MLPEKTAAQTLKKCLLTSRRSPGRLQEDAAFVIFTCYIFGDERRWLCGTTGRNGPTCHKCVKLTSFFSLRSHVTFKADSLVPLRREAVKYDQSQQTLKATSSRGCVPHAPPTSARLSRLTPASVDEVMSREIHQACCFKDDPSHGQRDGRQVSLTRSVDLEERQLIETENYVKECVTFFMEWWPHSRQRVLI